MTSAGLRPLSVAGLLVTGLFLLLPSALDDNAIQAAGDDIVQAKNPRGPAGNELSWDPENPDTIAFPATEARTVRLVLTGQRHCGLDEVEIFGPGSADNLALASAGAKVRVSSAYNGYPPERLIDGAYGAQWLPRGPGDSWMEVTFAAPARIDRVVLSCDRAHGSKNRAPDAVGVITSLDGKTSTVAARAGVTEDLTDVLLGKVTPTPSPPADVPDKGRTVPSLGGLLCETLQFDCPPQSAQFVRVLLRSERAGRGYPSQVDEIEVFGPSSHENLAAATRGARVSAASHAPATGRVPKHIRFANDGNYGSASSWVSGSGPSWLQVELPRVSPVARVLVSADRVDPSERNKGTLVWGTAYLSEDGRTWVKMEGGRAFGAAGATSPVVDGVDDAFSVEACRKRSPTPLKDALAAYQAMADRYSAAGLDVSGEKSILTDLQKQVAAVDPRTAWPDDVQGLYLKLRRAKRQLMLRDPQLAVLERLLFVKRHPYLPSHNYTDFTDGQLKGGGGVYRLDTPRASGRLAPDRAVLTRLFDAGAMGIARDVALDWDAETVWFAYMPDVSGDYFDARTDRSGRGVPDTPETRRWQIYRMPAAGGEATQVTSGPYHDYYPCVLADGDIAFVTTRCNKRYICFRPTSMTLFRMRRDGSQIRAVSHNNLSEWFPTVRRDGRVMWTRSEYLDKGADFGHTIWTVWPDGTHCELVYGNNVGNFGNAMEVPGKPNELCALRISHFGDFNGPVIYIDLAKGPFAPDAQTCITPDATATSNAGVFRDPVPVTENLVLVSHKDGPHWALYVIDRFGNREVLYRDPAIGCMTPIPLRKRERPPVVPDVTSEGDATMLVMDVYDGLGDTVERGSVKWLRIARELPSPLERYEDGHRMERYYGGGQYGFMSYYASPVKEARSKFGWPTYTAKAVEGVVPVDADGSAHFTVPTGVMIYFQALDQEFNEIQRMRSIIQAQPGEYRTCVGCHDDRMRTAMPTKRVSAMSRPADKPLPPPWGAGPFWYEKAVQPVLDKHCVSCHDGNSRAKKLNLTGTLDEKSHAPASYLALLQGSYVHHFSHGWDARHFKAPPLSFGTAKSNLFEYLADDNHKSVKLSKNERRAIKCWIDLNCPLWGDNQHRDLRAAGRTYVTVCPEGCDAERRDLLESSHP